MKTFLTLLLLASMLSMQVACAPRTKSGATAMTIGGVALAATGGLMLAELNSPGDDTNGNGRDDFPENDIACAFGGCAIGALMLGTGLLFAVMGMAYSEPEKPADAGPVAGPPGLDLTVRDPAEPTETITRIDVSPALPEVPVDAETLQLAKQARAAAQQGDCQTAEYVVDRIEDRDRRYAAAFVASPAFARCMKP